MAEATAAAATPEKPAKGKGKRARAGKKEKRNVPHGIATVLVNGITAVEAGRVTGRLGGRVLRR